MITFQNADNKALYNKLFEDATQDLLKKGILNEGERITSLEDYFLNLGDLYNDGEGSKYIMLPLDEPPFDIDADSRVITVPANFKRHGISVQGDEIAETLFFRINRYFDAVDFDTCRIFVQWEGPEGIKYITPITLKDVESQPGYLIFAWPLSSTLTKIPGPIKFSVRFIKQMVDNAEIEDETTIPTGSKNHIVYSYSTLTATAVINPGLNYDIFDTLKDSPNSLFLHAITNSTSTTGIKAAKPYFVVELPGDGIVPYPQYLGEDRSLTLTVQANADDTGVISYEWYYAKENKEGSSMGRGVDEYRPTEDTVPQENKTYYEEEQTLDGKPYRPVYDVSSGAFIEGKQAYERFNNFTITGDGSESVTGLYFVTATNRFGKSTTTTDSFIVELPTATVPVITKDLINSVIEAEDGVALKIEYTVHEESLTSHEWMRTLNKDGSNFALVEGATEAEFKATLPGYYKVNVISEVNLDIVDKESSVVRVTALPEAPVFDDDYADEVDGVANTSLAVDASEIEELALTMKYLPGSNTDTYPVDLQTDNIYYTWVQDMGEKGIAFNEDGTIADAVGNDNVIFQEASATPVLPMSASVPGLQLRCVATNELNGKRTNSVSRLFVFF